MYTYVEYKNFNFITDGRMGIESRFDRFINILKTSIEKFASLRKVKNKSNKTPTSFNNNLRHMRKKIGFLYDF